ncbi:hypothetical protein EJB05_09162, partial [Eragrostis curvula]
MGEVAVSGGVRELLSLPTSGYHWSLLVFDDTSPSSGPRFVHHDSIQGAPNFPVAERLVDALSPLLVDAPGSRVPLVPGPTPSQTNDYDCGVYVMAIARAVCSWWIGRGEGGISNWFDAVRAEVDAARVKAMRPELLELINHLIEEKAKARAE